MLQALQKIPHNWLSTRGLIGLFVARVIVIAVWTVIAFVLPGSSSDRIIDLCLAAFFALNFVLTLGGAEFVGWGSLLDLLFNAYVITMIFLGSTFRNGLTFLLGLVLLVTAGVVTSIENKRRSSRFVH